MHVRFLVAGIPAILLPALLSAQKPKLHVAIVGGGMAGVSSAHFIHEYDPEASITLFEKEKTLGGNAKTVTVPNARNEPVRVDAGPQYFTEGPWDEYLRFLKTYGQYKPEETSEFVGSIIIQSKGTARPRLVTPLNGSFRGESLGQLLRFKKFCDTAFEVFRKPDGEHAPSIGDWVKNLEAGTEFKQQVILPFLAASLGTSVGDIQKTSTAEIVKLFAFRKPSNKNTFKVMHRGMGTLIKNIGDTLQDNGIRVVTQAPVQQVEHKNGQYTVRYGSGTDVQEETFDFVVLAVHANQAYRILHGDTGFTDVSAVLQKFEYFKARIVLHGDRSLVNKDKPAFLNVMTTEDNEIVANTMDLGMIDERYKGIYKSWITEEMCTRIKAGGHFFHEEIFYHPLITPAFNAALAKLNQALQLEKGLHLSGGWTQGLETQETAVISGKKAKEKYEAFKRDDS